MPRHPNDTVERLWRGAADPTKPRFVPVELRGLVTEIPADIEERMHPRSPPDRPRDGWRSPAFAVPTMGIA